MKTQSLFSGFSHAIYKIFINSCFVSNNADKYFAGGNIYAGTSTGITLTLHAPVFSMFLIRIRGSVSVVIIWPSLFRIPILTILSKILGNFLKKPQY
jgi:hypothetical protein